MDNENLYSEQMKRNLTHDEVKVLNAIREVKGELGSDVVWAILIALDYAGQKIANKKREKISSILAKYNLDIDETLKRAAARIEQGDDLTREYDRETDSLKPL